MIAIVCLTSWVVQNMMLTYLLPKTSSIQILSLITTSTCILFDLHFTVPRGGLNEPCFPDNTCNSNELTCVSGRACYCREPLVALNGVCGMIIHFSPTVIQSQGRPQNFGEIPYVYTVHFTIFKRQILFENHIGLRFNR